MRRTFRESSQYLETTPVQMADSEAMLLEMWRDQTKAYGIDLMKVKIEHQKELGRPITSDEERRVLQKEIMKFTLDRRTSKRAVRNGGMPLTEFENKLIEESELVNYLNDGWEIVRQMGSGKVVRKVPENEVLSPLEGSIRPSEMNE